LEIIIVNWVVTQKEFTMGFFGKIKGFFGIGGIKVTMEIPTEANKTDELVKGKISLFSKSDQHVLSLNVKMIEEYSTGRGENKTTKEYTLGKLTLVKEKNAFDIKAQETKTYEFDLPFAMLKSKNDELKEKGGITGGLGKMGSFMDAEKSKYFIEAEADVKGTALDPSAKKAIKLN
jgi:SpoOM protein